jgi:UDP-glucose 4-epimerase
MSPSTVLVTGASRFIGGHLAARLAADPGIDRVIALDTTPPRPELSRRLGRAEVVTVDLRNPLIAKVIADARVDTVVHASMIAAARTGGSRDVLKQVSVLGTMQLLAACQRSKTVTQLVVKSTGAVYGASSRDQAVFTEGDEANEIPASGYVKDVVDVEGYLRGFIRRRPDVDVTVLRFANVIGPRIDTVLSRYFALRIVPTVLGYDGRLQLLHEEDALTVLERATRVRLPGVFNIGGDGVLLVSQAIRRAGGIAVPVPGPVVGTVARLLRAARSVDYSPDYVRFLSFGRVLDITRLRTEFGFTPRWTTVQAFDDYVRARALRPAIDPVWVTTAQRCTLGLAAQLR